MALTAKLRSPFGLGENLSVGVSQKGRQKFRLRREKASLV